MSVVINEFGEITDTRNTVIPVLMGDGISIAYTLMSDDITKGEKPSCTPYLDRTDSLEWENGAGYGNDTKTVIKTDTILDGIIIEASTYAEGISEYGVNLPFNFMGKINGGGWKNQYLFNSPYTSPDKSVIYAYLTSNSGRNLVVAVLSSSDGWKMDYSPYSFGHYFINLKLLANYDKVYGTPDRQKYIKIAILPVSSFEDCLEKLSRVYNKPFLYADLLGGKVGEAISLSAYGEPDTIIEKRNGGERVCNYTDAYVINAEGETELIPVKDGKRGAPITVYGYGDLVSLYKKSMDSADPEIVAKYTDRNLCEHQCWASAMLRFLKKYSDRLTNEEKITYEKKVRSLLDEITEQDINKATPRVTIFNQPHDGFHAYNVFKSRRVQELAHGITILADAYLYFGDERYYEYAKGATKCLISHYQAENGRIEIDWGDKKEDYTTVCCPMIPISDMARILSTRDKEFSDFCYRSADKMAEYLYIRGTKFPTEGIISSNAEEEMEDGSISCTALALLYYCKNVRKDEKYLQKAKEILDLHDIWVINTPVCQMKGSTLRWWETQWEGDADGPAICAGHAWTIWRAEADHLYYQLTGDTKYLKKATNGFMTNLSKIQKDGTTYSVYNPDEINGGGFDGILNSVRYRVAKRFSDREDCGISRYVWIRINDAFLKCAHLDGGDTL